MDFSTRFVHSSAHKVHESLTVRGVSAKFKPSMVQDDGTKPVRVSSHAKRVSI